MDDWWVRPMARANGITQRDPRWLARLLRRYQGQQVLAIGIPLGSEGASARYPDGSALLVVAAANNFGTVDGRIPRRSFMELGAEKTHQRNAPLLPGLIRRINAQTLSKPDALKILGPLAVGQHQAAIVELREPPNAEATVARKQSDNPLIDTSLLRQSMTFSVRAEP